ncbi:hypothetical protein HDU91_007057 [Kappamyces sp. JEL0680]|nr:hypothetical protein HDU91_007057 [Kappamyces sp. JEL0680]
MRQHTNNDLLSNSGQSIKHLLQETVLDWKSVSEQLAQLQEEMKELALITTPMEADAFQIKMREKEKENVVLQLMVRQYESTLGLRRGSDPRDIIMKKFRMQTNLIKQEQERATQELQEALDLEMAENNRLRRENAALVTHLESCTKVVRDAVGLLDDAPIENPADVSTRRPSLGLPGNAASLGNVSIPPKPSGSSSSLTQPLGTNLGAPDLALIAKLIKENETLRLMLTMANQSTMSLATAAVVPSVAE